MQTCASRHNASSKAVCMLVLRQTLGIHLIHRPAEPCHLPLGISNVDTRACGHWYNILTSAALMTTSITLITALVFGGRLD